MALILRRAFDRAEPIRHNAGRVGVVLATAVAAGYTLHLLLHQFGIAFPLGHHVFHVLYIGTAGLLFWGYVAFYVRRHGWPLFRWRLAAGEEST